MSAGGEASVSARDFNLFWRFAFGFINGDLSNGTVVDLLINGEVSEGWAFYSHEFVDNYDIILRRPLDETIGTAEYVKVLFPDDGEGVRFVQSVVIQNDNNYIGTGNERFGALVDAYFTPL
jgi:hypothetical protein